VDRGYLGTSGATAATGTGVSYVDPFPVREDGHQIRSGLKGPEDMRRMRIRVRRSRVRVLDHIPVTELLVDAEGAVAPRPRSPP